MKRLPNGLMSEICNSCCYIEHEDIMIYGVYQYYRCRVTGSVGQVTKDDFNRGFLTPTYKILPDCPLEDIS